MMFGGVALPNAIEIVIRYFIFLLNMQIYIVGLLVFKYFVH